MTKKITKRALLGWIDKNGEARKWHGYDGAMLYNIHKDITGIAKIFPNIQAAWRDAEEAGQVFNDDPTKAPVGAVHYFETLHPDWHAGIDMEGGGKSILTTGNGARTMGSGLVVKSYADIRDAPGVRRYKGWTIGYGHEV